MSNDLSRRQFLEFMGRSTLAATLWPAIPGCVSRPKHSSMPFSPLAPSATDQLLLADGFRYDVLLKWGDRLAANAHFGFNADYTAYLPLSPRSPDEGLLWVNHESVDPLFVTGWQEGKKRLRSDVAREMKEVGGSIVHLKKTTAGWQVVTDSRYNRRLDAHTRIPFVSTRPIEGQRTAMGTLANCAGGVTPWQTILTCEENYDEAYGDYVTENGARIWQPGKRYSYWRDFYKNPPEHYGWVVEVNPFTGQAKKLTALGRFSHECATTIEAKDGRTVVYSGDDRNDQCLYKFIAAKPNTLEQGELFVADITNGRWLSLNIQTHPELKKRFKDQTDVLIHCREAAHLVGATPLDRPEDVEIDPTNKAVFVALSNNKDKGNFHGSLLKIEEDGQDPLSLTFKASTFLAGGPSTGFSCPDNMAFDRKGNLWMTNDISGSSLNQKPYTEFKNNSLYYIPMAGDHAGQVFQVASSPVTAELSGPSFSPDGRTLFLSVQHPGEGTKDLTQPLSHWPEGGTSLPRSAVVTLSGPALDRLVGS